MTVIDSQKLRGRMQFADGQVFGRLGRLCMRAVVQHAFPFKGEKLSNQTRDALRRFSMFLEHSGPRVLELASTTVFHIYTDACYEPHNIDWACGLGGVLVGPPGIKLGFFSISLSAEQMNLLGALQKKTIIFEAELLAIVLAFAIWGKVLRSASVIAFIDNNASRDVAISGAGRNAVANSLIEFLLKLEMSNNLTPWYSRVPTPSNVADELSRGELQNLIKQQVSRAEAKTELDDVLKVLGELVG